MDKLGERPLRLFPGSSVPVDHMASKWRKCHCVPSQPLGSCFLCFCLLCVLRVRRRGSQKLCQGVVFRHETFHVDQYALQVCRVAIGCHCLELIPF